MSASAGTTTPSGPPLLSSAPVVATVHDIIWWVLPEYRGGALVREKLLARSSNLLVLMIEAPKQVERT